MRIAGVNSFGNDLFKKTLFKRNEVQFCPTYLKSSPLKDLKIDTFSIQSKN